ncbi:MAG: flagellar hook-basal body complex protein [Pirellulales bacterium]|nr:flagellar hook-basal body complex protein [Pirellulales bacterium]
MGLASALSTALTGLTAAETTIDVVGNNLANSNTVGFKASEAAFATQFLQTQSLGSKPTENNGGTNPRQTGLGTMVAAITPDFGQGTIEISSNPMDMAIQGDGFFIVQGGSGEQLYTRNGIFKLNAENQITTITGNRVLGYGIDSQFQIERTQLVPLTINLGGAEVAEATENVYLEGTLTPAGDVATTAGIIRSGALGDDSYSQPAGGATAAASVAPDVVGPPPLSGNSANGAGGMTPGTYYYRIVYGDGEATLPTIPESMASATVAIPVAAGDNMIDLADIPVDPTAGAYATRLIYRSAVDQANGPFYLVTNMGNNVDTTYPDVMSDAVLATQPQLNTETLTGNYTYYVTFINAAGIESRPSPAIVQNINGGRVELRDLPVQTPGDQWIARKIYRNTNTSPNTWYDLGVVLSDADTANIYFTDHMQDATLELQPTLDFDGPKITDNTLLTDIISRDGSSYPTLFELGTLSFSGKKGGRSIVSKDFTIGASTTVAEMVLFMEEAMGIVRPPGPDAAHPIPVDGGTGSQPGGRIDASTGQIVFTSNNGVDNAVSISLSGLKLTPTGASASETVNMPFSSTQTAIGQSAVTDFIAYDSLGMAIQVRLTAVMESRDNTSTIYRWFADSPDNQTISGYDINVGTGLVSFDGEGNFISATNSTVSIFRRQVPSRSPLEFDLNFSQISGLAAETASLAVSRQDGSGPGTLTSFIVGEDGTIRGVFSNGITRDLGQFRLARFGNPSGLEQKGENLFAAGVNSGLPIEGDPGQQGIGTMIAGATELSNTDIGKNLIDLILASTMYRGNTRVITTSQEMLDELLALRR